MIDRASAGVAPASRARSQLSDVDAYLQTRGLSLKALEPALEGGPPVGLAFIGSIASGRANGLSDIDLVAVGADTWAAPADALVVESRVSEVAFRLDGGQEINIECWPRALIDGLLAKLDAASGPLTDRAAGPKLVMLLEWEFRGLYNLAASVVLQDSEYFQELRARIDFDALAGVALVRHLATHYALREDAIGQLAQGDPENAAWMMRSAMFALARATLASVGDIEPSEKWVIALLRDRRQVIGEAPADVYLDALRHWPQGDVREHLRAAISFADGEFIRLARRRRDLMPAFERLGRLAETAVRL